MRNIFNMDNAFWRALSRMADLMILNIIFLLTCIPIVTIGAALTGLNYVTLKLRDGSEGYITRTYFKSFRENFRQATLIWLLFLVVGIILVLDFLILRDGTGTMVEVMQVGIFVLAILYIIVFLYVFPVLCRFVNTVWGTLKNSFIMAIADFPRTLALIAISAAAWIVTFLNYTTLMWGILVWILIGFALLSYLQMYFMQTILKKYMPEEEEESDPDEWVQDENEPIPDDLKPGSSDKKEDASSETPSEENSLEITADENPSDSSGE